MDVKQGFQHGCVASPHLFSMYTEMLMHSINGMRRIKVGGTMIRNLKSSNQCWIRNTTVTTVGHRGRRKWDEGLVPKGYVLKVHNHTVM